MYTRKQYSYVQESRNILFDYCKTISAEDFIRKNSSFGRGGSIRNLLVHIANTYEFWIAKLALGRKVVFAEFEDNKNIQNVISVFDYVDLFMGEFIDYANDTEGKIEFELNGVKRSEEPIKLFTHVITHEYHHKGQILSLSRHLGYIPVDTDIMR